MRTFVVVLLTIIVTAPTAALATSYAEYRKQYNLWDLLKDKYEAIKARLAALWSRVKTFISALKAKVGLK
jgi:hypothetical protein